MSVSELALAMEQGKCCLMYRRDVVPKMFDEVHHSSCSLVADEVASSSL